MNVPLRAAFRGVRAFPWIALASSDIAPALALDPAGIDFRVAGKMKRRGYGAVDWVDFRTAPGTRNLILAFTGSMWTFTANIAEDKAARTAIAQLHDRGCTLTERATRFLAGF